MLPENINWNAVLQSITDTWLPLIGMVTAIILVAIIVHTFCSNMAKSGMNPKTLQYLMGHSDIGVTLNTYTHVQYDDVETEMKRVVNAEW